MDRGLVFHFKKVLAIVVLQIPLASYGFTSSSDSIGGVPVDHNVNISRFAPVNLNHVPEVLISRDAYLLSYNPETRLVNWAAWKMEASDIGHTGRTNNFIADPDLQTYLAQTNKMAVVKQDFQGSCYDRGHQVPSADRDVSPELNQLTFYMSNMVPQTAYLNRVIWEHLESYTRTLVTAQKKKVYIIAGPIYDEDFGKIGPNNDIPVPSKEFKILISLPDDQDINDPNVKPDIIAVVMPNILQTGKKAFEDKTELCKESLSLGQKPATPVPPTVAVPPTAPGPTPMPPGLTSFLESLKKRLPVKGSLAKSKNKYDLPVTTPPIVIAVPPPVNNVNNDWMQFQTSLDDIEKLSGFRITTSQ